MKINIRRLNDQAILPTQGSADAAGFDLYSIEDQRVCVGATKLIKTGIALELPKGYEGQVRSRSGLSKNGIVVANSPGTVDSDYRGEVGVLIHNQGKLDYTIRTGDRIAQLVIQEVPTIQLVEVEDLTDTDRGSGGFGSTGRN